MTDKDESTPNISTPDFGGNPYQTEQKLYLELCEVIFNYKGLTSTVAVLGILDLVKDHVKRNG